MAETDLGKVVEIAGSLPQWFTATGLQNIQRDISFQKGLVAVLQSKVVGFVTFYAFEGKGYIGWMGVSPEHQRHGIGRMLIECLEDVLTHAGIGEIFVNTLGESVNYEPYAATRSFYRKMGFIDFRRTFTDEKECPEQLCMVKKLVV